MESDWTSPCKQYWGLILQNKTFLKFFASIIWQSVSLLLYHLVCHLCFISGVTDISYSSYLVISRCIVKLSYSERNIKLPCPTNFDVPWCLVILQRNHSSRSYEIMLQLVGILLNVATCRTCYWSEIRPTCGKSNQKYPMFPYKIYGTAHQQHKNDPQTGSIPRQNIAGSA